MSAEIEHLINEIVLPTISYKEGVKFEVVAPTDQYDFTARLLARVPCVDDPHSREVMVYRVAVLNKRLMTKLLDGGHVEDFRDYVINTFWGLVVAFEMHEAEEWFRVDGKSWHDPHPTPETS